MRGGYEVWSSLFVVALVLSSRVLGMSVSSCSIYTALGPKITSWKNTIIYTNVAIITWNVCITDFPGHMSPSINTLYVLQLRT